MRWWSLLPFAGVLACTGQPAVSEGPGPPPAVYTTPTSAEIRLARDDFAPEGVVDATPQETWQAALRVYKSLGLPMRVQDPRAGTLQTSPFVPERRRFMDRPLHELVDCGNTMAGPRVRLWTVTFELLTRVEEDPGGARMSTRLAAYARTREGASTDPVPCTSSGRVERELLRITRQVVQS